MRLSTVVAAASSWGLSYRQARQLLDRMVIFDYSICRIVVLSTIAGHGAGGRSHATFSGDCRQQCRLTAGAGPAPRGPANVPSRQIQFALSQLDGPPRATSSEGGTQRARLFSRGCPLGPTLG